MADQETLPMDRERAIFEAATRGTPEGFVRLCRIIGRDPTQMLDIFDAQPSQRLILRVAQYGGSPEVEYPTRIRVRLDAIREYVETPWWRRLGRR
jgi:hypothetical protein